jgi:hypothetical protein
VTPLVRFLDLASASALAAILFAGLGAGPILAATPTVECGQLSAYTAPVPAGPTDGSLTLGLSSTWVINADATISSAAAAALPSAVNSGPSCLSLGLDGSGHITSLDFAPHGTISGHVTFDSADSFYIFNDRLIVPTNVTDAYPPLDALFATSYQAGTTLTVTFTIDTTTGALTGFDGHAAFCGAASVDSKGNGHVGKATLPAAVIDKTAGAALKAANGGSACAAVHSTGSINTGNGHIATTANVVITLAAAAATPPATTTLPSGPVDGSPDALGTFWIALTAALGLVILRFSDRRARRG